MDHFCIRQVCHGCWRGEKEFRVDLALYDDARRLPESVHSMEKFSFICPLCCKKTKLDFYKFSHPDMILHLRRLHQQNEQRRKALDQLYIVFNNDILK